MTDLHRILKSQIFTALEAEDIPVGEDDLQRFRRELHATCRLPWEHWDTYRQAAEEDPNGPEAFDQVARRVFRFGQQIGNAVGDLLPPSTVALGGGASLVGAFNFGISYYDYLMDEGSEGPAQLLRALDRIRLEAWWLTGQRTPLHNQNPQLAFLWACIDYIFSEARQRIPETGTHFSDQFAADLVRMFEAENLVGDTRLQEPVPEQAIENALKNKSSLPFWVMVQIMLWGSQRAEDRWPCWQEFGMALGRLYALVDDAKDISNDLRSRRWNLLTLEAIKRGFLEWSPSANTNLLIGQLVNHLTYSSFIPELAAIYSSQLKSSLEELGLVQDRRRAFNRFLGASLATWYG